MRLTATCATLGCFVLTLAPLPACRSPRERQSRWRSLARCGVQYSAPPGWKVFDPPVAADAQAYPRGETWLWFIPTLDRDQSQAEFVSPGGTMVAVVCASRWAPMGGTTLGFGQGVARSFEELLDQNYRHLLEGVLMSNQEESTLRTADGFPLRYVHAHVAAGLLAGKESVHGFAGGQVGGRLMLVDAGAHPEDYRRQDVESLVKTLSVR